MEPEVWDDRPMPPTKASPAQQGVLSGPEIARIEERSRFYDPALGHIIILPHIRIEPFDPDRVGPNSYDVALGDRLRVYGTNAEVIGEELLWRRPDHLDPYADNPTCEVTIPPSGLFLRPGSLYLGVTVERTQTAGLVPWLDGRSSIGRLGIQVHVTAGRGDDGFGCAVPGGCPWTLEISVLHKVKIYPGLIIGQLTYLTLTGERKGYAGRYSAQDGPTASRLWNNEDKE